MSDEFLTYFVVVIMGWIVAATVLAPIVGYYLKWWFSE